LVWFEARRQGGCVSGIHSRAGPLQARSAHRPDSTSSPARRSRWWATRLPMGCVERCAAHTCNIEAMRRLPGYAGHTCSQLPLSEKPGRAATSQKQQHRLWPSMEATHARTWKQLIRASKFSNRNWLKAARRWPSMEATHARTWKQPIRASKFSNRNWLKAARRWPSMGATHARTWRQPIRASIS